MVSHLEVVFYSRMKKYSLESNSDRNGVKNEVK